MPASLFSARVLDRIVHTHDVFDLLLQPLSDFSFAPGQFVSVQVPQPDAKKCFRAYSIASSPTRPGGQFLLNVKLVTFTDNETGEECRGQGSGYLHDLQVGDEATFLGPAGVLTFDDASAAPLILAGTGTGVAPLMCLLEYMADRGIIRPTTLYFGVRYAEDLYYQDRIMELQTRLPDLTVHYGVSRADGPADAYRVGRLTTLLEQDIQTVSPETEAYVCGGTASSQAIGHVLTSRGLDPKHLHVEGYG